MAQRIVLQEHDVQNALRSLPGWSIKKGKLHKTLVFGSFREAFTFMAGAALIAEKLNHHPDWSNVYNRVVVDLMTHDAGGITDLDLTFAGEADRIALGLGAG